MATQSPKASWKAFTSRNGVSHRSGRRASSRPWPTSCATTSVLAPELLRVDGVHKPAVACPVEAIVGGDGKVPAIMAASVLAKVARDAEMRRLDLEHPGYGFAEHKGYATPQHLEALQRLGPCAIHRRGFEPVLQMNLALECVG